MISGLLLKLKSKTFQQVYGSRIMLLSYAKYGWIFLKQGFGERSTGFETQSFLGVFRKHGKTKIGMFKMVPVNEA